MLVRIFEFNVPGSSKHNSSKIRDIFVVDLSPGRVRLFAEEKPVAYSRLKPLIEHIWAFKDVYELDASETFGYDKKAYADLIVNEPKDVAYEYAYAVQD